MKKKMLSLILAALISGTMSAAATEDTMGQEWEKISIYDIKNPATLFGEEWAAVAAGNKESFNAMTIGWGQFGILWKRPIMTIYVAPERYTNEFLDKNEYFTVTGFPQTQKQALVYIGTHSGRNEDKLAKAGLTPIFTPLGNPIFKEANLAVECKIIYKEPFNSELLDQKAKDLYTANKITPHVQYIGEVINVWRKKE